MAFSWSTNILLGSKIKAGNIAEVRAVTDTCEDAAYGCTTNNSDDESNDESSALPLHYLSDDGGELGQEYYHTPNGIHNYDELSNHDTADLTSHNDVVYWRNCSDAGCPTYNDCSLNQCQTHFP